VTWEPNQSRNKRKAKYTRTARVLNRIKPEDDLDALNTPHLDQFLRGYTPDSAIRKFFANGGSIDSANFLIKKHGLPNIAIEWQRFLQKGDLKAFSPLLLGTMTYLFECLAEEWMKEMSEPTLLPLSFRTTRHVTSNMDVDRPLPNPDNYLIDSTGNIPNVRAIVLKTFSPHSPVKSQHIAEIEDMAQAMKGSITDLKGPLQVPELQGSRIRQIEFQNPFVFVVTPLRTGYTPDNPMTKAVETPFFMTQIRDAAGYLLDDISGLNNNNT
jgi:hypothetical protein